MLEKRAAHLVRVVGDNGVQAWPCAAPMASGDDGDAVPCLLRSELIARELGRQLAELRCCARHADHGVPAGIMMCLAPRRPVVAAISTLPAAAPDVFHAAERDADSRVRAGALTNAYELGPFVKSTNQYFRVMSATLCPLTDTGQGGHFLVVARGCLQR